jgi:hypothetical protein
MKKDLRTAADGVENLLIVARFLLTRQYIWLLFTVIILSSGKAAKSSKTIPEELHGCRNHQKTLRLVL